MEALASCDRALALQPNFAEAHANRAIALHGLERFADALLSYDRALVLRPDLADVLVNRGTTLHAMKRLDDALADFDQALTHDAGSRRSPLQSRQCALHAQAL